MGICPRRTTVDHGRLTNDLPQQSIHFNKEFRTVNLGGRSIGHFQLPLRHRPGLLVANQLQRFDTGTDFGQIHLNPGLIHQFAACRRIGLAGPAHDVIEQFCGRAEVHQTQALAIQLAGNQLPAAIQLTDQCIVTDPDVVVEGGIGPHAAKRNHRAAGPTGITGRHHEHGNAFVGLGGIGVSATGQPHVVAEMRQTGPHFLAINQPAITLSNGRRLQARQIGARPRL